jgi:Ras family protein
VSKEEGSALAASWGSTAFLETSARTGENVQRVFEQIVVQIEAELNPAPAPAQKGGCALM